MLFTVQFEDQEEEGEKSNLVSYVLRLLNFCPELFFFFFVFKLIKYNLFKKNKLKKKEKHKKKKKNK